MLKMRLSKVAGKLLPFAVGILTFVIGFGSLYYRNPVVLEITVQGYGMVYPEAEILELRVYQNGRVEYDSYPDQENAFFNPRYWFPRQHAKLSRSEAAELIGLAEQNDFLSAKEKYEAGYPHIDDEWKTTIKYSNGGREKQIVAINFWDARRPEDAAKYPESMVTLLKKVKALRSKLTGRPN